MKTTILIAGLLAATSIACARQPVVAEDDYQKLMRLADVGQWGEELPLAQRLSKDNPTHPDVWLALGWGYKYTGSFEQALAAFRKAGELGAWKRGNLLVEIASCQAANGDKAAALGSLELALEAGYPYRSGLRTNKFFDSLKADPKFKDLTAQIDTSQLSRDQKWQRDISFLISEIERVHYNPYKSLSRAQWKEKEATLTKAVPKLSDDELIAELMKIGASLGDGHSGLENPFSQADTYDALPILLGHFEDGIYVTASTPDTEPLLWAQVLKVEGKAIADVMERLSGITPRDNGIRPKSVAPSYIRYPRLLKGLGLAKAADGVELELKTRSGETKTVKLAAVQTPIASWVRDPADGSGHQPQYAGKRGDLYWFEYQPGDKLVYFQYNGVGNKDDESIQDFSTRLFDFIKGNEVERLVVDLRWNGGGDNFLNKPLLSGIIGSKVNKTGGLFVIAGRHTFSAAMIFAEQLERYTDATFVGEPTGSSPNFVGETVMIDLPCTGYRFSISNLYWQTSHAMDERSYIPPKLYVPYLFSDWKAGRDASMERIRAFIRAGS